MSDAPIPDPASPAPAAAPVVRGLRLNIRIKVFLVLVLLATVCSLVMSRTLVGFFNEDKSTYIQDLNADIAANTATSVGLLLRFYEEELARTAELFNGASDPGPALAERFAKQDDLVYLAIYDATGANVLSLIREARIEEAGLDVAAFRRARERAPASPAYFRAHRAHIANSSAAPGLLTFSLALPFHAARYEETFFLRGDIDSRHLLRAIERTPGFTTYIVDNTGTALAHPDPEVLAGGGSLAARPVVQSYLANLSVAAAGTGEFETGDGAGVLASYAAVRDADLGVMVERPRADAYSAAARLTTRSMQAAAIIALIATAFSVYLSRKVTAPLLELSRAAGRLERGDFDVHVNPATHDELGDLARSFNLAAQGLKERDLKLKETYDQLLQSEKLAGFGKFSAGIAHEIKNPLTGIIGFAQILARKLPAGDPKRPPLAMIEKEAKRCKSILDNLLKFTRKEGFQFEPVRIHAHIQETLDLVQPQIGVHHVAVATALEAPEDLIRGDSNQLRQVFMNLILNACDAMEGRPLKRIAIATAAAEAGYLEIRLQDTGSGIPADKLRKVFDPFFTTKEPGKGTGLGLSVSYGIVTNHGGRISVRSEDGQGAEFRIVLPLASAEVRAEERRRRASGESGASTPADGVPVGAGAVADVRPGAA